MASPAEADPKGNNLMTTTPRRRTAAAIASLAALAAIASGCAAGTSSSGADSSSPAGAGERLTVSLAGSVVVLDAATLDPVAEFDSEEFTRVNPVGDGRNVLVTTSAGFQVLDAVEPELTDTVFAADAAGHVVRHGGRTVLFADGTGTTTVFPTDALIDSDGALPETTTRDAEEPHHGVSIVLDDGTLVTTVGDDTSRSGAVALAPHDDHYHEHASSDQCPGIHGEGTALGEAVVFGCENGALLYSGGEFTKLDAPDEFGRMGNAFVSETSPIVVGDYKNDPDAEGYELHSVALIDTANASYRVQELDGIAFTWRGVVRGPNDDAYILGTDGAIHVLDPITGDVTAEYPVIDAWEGPADWQDEHPAMITDGTTAYVADVANSRIVSVDLATGDVIAEGAELSGEPGEMALNIG